MLRKKTRVELLHARGAGRPETLPRGTIINYPREGLFVVTNRRKSRRHKGWYVIIAQAVHPLTGEELPWKLVLLMLGGKAPPWHYHAIYDDRAGFPYSPIQLAEGLGQ